MIRKKLLALILVLAIMFSIVPMALSAEDDDPPEDPGYSISGPAGVCQRDDCGIRECMRHCRNCQEIKENCECTIGFRGGLINDHATWGALRNTVFTGNKIDAITGVDAMRNAGNVYASEHVVMFWQNTGHWTNGRRPDCLRGIERPDGW